MAMAHWCPNTACLAMTKRTAETAVSDNVHRIENRGNSTVVVGLNAFRDEKLSLPFDCDDFLFEKQDIASLMAWYAAGDAR